MTLQLFSIPFYHSVFTTSNLQELNVVKIEYEFEFLKIQKIVIGTAFVKTQLYFTDPYKEQLVAVVSDASGITTTVDMQDKKLCHSGYENNGFVSEVVVNVSTHYPLSQPSNISEIAFFI